MPHKTHLRFVGMEEKVNRVKVETIPHGSFFVAGGRLLLAVIDRTSKSYCSGVSVRTGGFYKFFRTDLVEPVDCVDIVVSEKYSSRIKNY